MREIKKLKVELETLSPFRIGAKKLFSGIDQPIVKIGGKIVVPGTTLKGALRHQIEDYLIEKYSEREEMKPCIPSTEKGLSEDEKILIKNRKYRGESCHYPCKKREGPGNQPIKHSICPACYLLGAQGIIGFVSVPFLEIKSNTLQEEFTSIRIDRAKGTAAEGHLRTSEILPAGAKFEGILTVLIKDDIRGWELGKPRPLGESTLGDEWLKNSEWDKEKIIEELIKKRLEAIEVLGGFKSSGAGRVKISVSNAS